MCTELVQQSIGYFQYLSLKYESIILAGMQLTDRGENTSHSEQNTLQSFTSLDLEKKEEKKQLFTPDTQFLIKT